MILKNITRFSSLFQSRRIVNNLTQNKYFSSLQKQTKLLTITNNELFKRNIIKVKVIRNHGNDSNDLKPFSLLEIQPFILPNNPFSMMFSQFMRAISIRLEMSRIDRTFDVKEFHAGAQMAIVTVSNRIANGHLEDLNDLVDQNLITELKKRYDTLSFQEKKYIPIKKEEIANQRIVGFNVSKQNGLFVRFKLLIYLMNMEKVMETKDEPETSVEEYFKKQLMNLMMAEYTFVRDYSNGSENSSWVITELNHYNSDYYGKCLREHREKE